MKTDMRPTLHTRTIPLATLLLWLLAILLFSALVWYVLFQARLVLSGPMLALDDNLASVYHTPTVDISGTAQNVTAITLNDRTIYVDEYGRFSEQLVLENGYTIMTIRARDRYGRETSVEHPFVYAPAYNERAEIVRAR